MHALLAHATQLALLPLHEAMLPAWRPLVVALAVAVAVRLAGGAPAMVASLAALAGWAAQDFAQLSVWPPPVNGRLPGLALILVLNVALRQRSKGAPGWWLLPATAALAGWWVRGAPLNGPGLVNCMPAFLGFLAALPLARRLAQADQGWASIAAAVALAGGLWVTGAPAIFFRAALVPACAAAALLGQAEAGTALAMPIVLAAAATIAATDHGRLTPIDAACLAPLLVWALSPALAPRVARSGHAIAGLLAAALCIGLAYAAERAMR
jgi:hypothetical protein